MRSQAVATAEPETIRQASEALAFRHLLHEVASHVTGLGLTLEMLGEPGMTPDDTASMVGTARGALDDLRYLVADVGELNRFLHRHGGICCEVVDPADLLADLAREGVTGELPHGLAPGCPRAIWADRTVIGFVLHMCARACRRTRGVVATASALPVGERFVRIDVCAAYHAQRDRRRSLEKAPLVLDHFCGVIAQELGGQFVREQSPAGQRVGFVLPVA